MSLSCVVGDGGCASGSSLSLSSSSSLVLFSVLLQRGQLIYAYILKTDGDIVNHWLLWLRLVYYFCWVVMVECQWQSKAGKEKEEYCKRSDRGNVWTGFAASERLGSVECLVVGRYGGRLNAWMSD